MSEEPKKPGFRRKVATIMASAVVAGVIFSWFTGLITTPEEGITSGMIIGLAAKYLWEENSN